MKKRTAKTKKRELLMPITVDVMRDVWAELVTRPEDLEVDELESMDVLADMFINQGNCSIESSLAARALFKLHYQTFIAKERVESGMVYAKVWWFLSLDERRDIYRNVGLSLGYDF